MRRNRTPVSVGTTALLLIFFVLVVAVAARAADAPIADASGNDVNALVRQLKGKTNERKQAMAELKRLGPAAAPALLDFIADETAGKDEVESAVAALAAIHRPDPSSARRDALLARREAAKAGRAAPGQEPPKPTKAAGGLHDLSAAARAKAVQAMPKLIEIMNRPGSHGDQAAIVLGGALPDSREAAAALGKMLDDSHRNEAERAALGLREMGSTGVLAACEALKDEKRAGSAAWALSEINDPSPQMSASWSKRSGVDLAPEPGLRAVNAEAKAALKRGIPALVALIKAKPTDAWSSYAVEVLGVIGADFPDAIAVVAEQAKKNDHAVAALLAMGMPAKAALVELATKTDRGTPSRRAAEQALAKLDATALPGVAEGVKTGSYEDRLAAVTKLSAGGPEAVPMLMDAMKTPIPRQESLESSRFTRAIADGLKRNREKAVAPLLAAIKQKDNAHLRMYAVFMAGELQLKEAVPLMRPMLAELSGIQVNGSPPTGRAEIPPEWMRWTLQRSMGAVLRGSPDALVETLSDPSPSVRLAALSELRFNGQKDPKTVSAIARLLSDADPEVAKSAKSAMEQRGEAAAEYLVDASKTSKDPLERAGAVRFLAKLPGDSATQGVTAALADADPRVRVAAVQAMNERRQFGPGITGRSGGEWPPDALLKVLTDDKAPEVRQAAAESLVYQSGPRGTAALLRAIKDADARVRIASLRALTSNISEPPKPEIVALLADPDPSVRRETVRQLGRAPTGPLVPRLLELAKHKEPGARAGAISLLGLAGGIGGGGTAARTADLARRKQASEAVAVGLGDADPGVRAAAAEALGRLRPLEATVLHKLSGMTWRERDEPARLAAATALVGYSSYAMAPWTPAGAAAQRARAENRIAASTQPGFGATTQPSAGGSSGRGLLNRAADVLAATVAPSEPPASVKALIADLSAAGDTRVEAAVALAHLGLSADSVAPVLAEVAERPDPAISAAAVAALASLARTSPDSAKPLADALLDSRSGKLRAHVALAWPMPGVGARGFPTTGPSTRPTAGPSARAFPTTAPSATEVPARTIEAAIKACAAALTGTDPEARALAAVTIGRFDPAAAVPGDAAIAALRSRHPTVRMAAIPLMSRTWGDVKGSTPASRVAALLAVIGDPRIDVSLAAAEALFRMNQFGDGGRVIGSAEQEKRLLELNEQQNSGDPARRAAAITEAAGFGRTAVYFVGAWRTALIDPDASVRKAAADALRSMHAALHGGAAAMPRGRTP